MLRNFSEILYKDNWEKTTCIVVFSVLRVQFQFCERIELHDGSKAVGINIILSAAEGEIVQVSSHESGLSSLV